MITTESMIELARERRCITVRIQGVPGEHAILPLWPANEDGSETAEWRCIVWTDKGPATFNTPSIDPARIDHVNPREAPMVVPPVDLLEPVNGDRSARAVCEAGALAARSGLELRLLYATGDAPATLRRVRVRGVKLGGILVVEDLVKLGVRSYLIAGIRDLRLGDGENRVPRWRDGAYVLEHR